MKLIKGILLPMRVVIRQMSLVILEQEEDYKIPSGIIVSFSPGAVELGMENRAVVETTYGSFLHFQVENCQIVDP